MAHCTQHKKGLKDMWNEGMDSWDKMEANEMVKERCDRWGKDEKAYILSKKKILMTNRNCLIKKNMEANW